MTFFPTPQSIILSVLTDWTFRNSFAPHRLYLLSIYFGITPLKAQLVFGLARPRIILTPESRAPTVSPFFPFKRAISPQDSVGDGVLHQAERHQCVFSAGLFTKTFPSSWNSKFSKINVKLFR